MYEVVLIGVHSVWVDDLDLKISSRSLLKFEKKNRALKEHKFSRTVWVYHSAHLWDLLSSILHTEHKIHHILPDLQRPSPGTSGNRRLGALFCYLLLFMLGSSLIPPCWCLVSSSMENMRTGPKLKAHESTNVHHFISKKKCPSSPSASPSLVTITIIIISISKKRSIPMDPRCLLRRLHRGASGGGLGLRFARLSHSFPFCRPLVARWQNKTTKNSGFQVPNWEFKQDKCRFKPEKWWKFQGHPSACAIQSGGGASCATQPREATWCCFGCLMSGIPSGISTHIIYIRERERVIWCI